MGPVRSPPGIVSSFLKKTFTDSARGLALALGRDLYLCLAPERGQGLVGGRVLNRGFFPFHHRKGPHLYRCRGLLLAVLFRHYVA